MPYKDANKQKQWQHEKYLKNKAAESQKAKEYKDKSRKHVYELRLNSKCHICGLDGITNPYAISFHHLNPEDKIMAIADMVRNGYSIENIDKEIHKCMPICENCHRKLHHIEGNMPKTSSKKRLDRIDFVRKYKSTHKCHICGESDYRCLDMVNINGDILTGEMPYYAYTLSEIEEALNMSKVICVNCHRKQFSNNN